MTTDEIDTLRRLLTKAEAEARRLLPRNMADRLGAALVAVERLEGALEVVWP